MSKTREDLAKSREMRKQIFEHFGEIPTSILKHDKNKKAIDLIADERNYYNTSNIYNLENNKLKEIFDVSGQSCRNGALSRFSQNIGRILLLLYTKEMDIVIDPFAGHNSRMELCWRNNRNYIGCDISHNFMEANKKIRDILYSEVYGDLFPEQFVANIELIECDSRELPLEDAIGDFTITSPPYWDLEYYGDEIKQLGNNNYSDFLIGLFEIAKENYRCLKNNSFCVWCVNDFRKNGKFYSYHEDTAHILRKAGFIQHDIIIIDLGQPIRAAFASQIIKTKIIPKRHEYCLIFKKPGFE